MSESSEVPMKEILETKSRPLFAKEAAAELHLELASVKKFDARMEREMVEGDPEKPRKTVREMLLQEVKEEFKVENPASLVRELENISFPETERQRIKAQIVKLAFTSMSLGDSIIKRLAESKGLNAKKLANDGSLLLVGLLHVARSTELLTTHISKGKIVETPEDTFFTALKRRLSPAPRREVGKVKIEAPWGHYLELGDQNQFLYPMRMGNAKDGSNTFVYEDKTEPASEKQIKALSQNILAICNSYLEVSDVANSSGQPFGFMDSENRRIVWNKEDHGLIPVVLAHKIDGKTKVKMVPVDPTLSQEQNEKVISEVCKGSLNKKDGWLDPSEIQHALFVISVDKKDRLMDVDEVKELFAIGNEYRPMCVMVQGEDDKGQLQTEIVMSHTVADGMAADLMVNGGRTQKRMRAGRGSTKLIQKAYMGFRGFYNREQSSDESRLHVNDQDRYHKGVIDIERCGDKGKQPEVIITRTIAEAEHGSDVMQASVMIANEIFIDVAKELSGNPIWKELPIGANTTHASKDNPLLRLVPASIYRTPADQFKTLPDKYAQYNEVWSLLTSLVSYKENRWLIDNHDEIQHEPQWNDHVLPASIESIAAITESNLPRRIKREIFKIQKHPWLSKLRFALSYNQTVITDKASNGEFKGEDATDTMKFDIDDNSALHKTVDNDGMPGVAIRQAKGKLGIVFSQSVTGDLVPADYLEPYAVLTTQVLLDTSKVLADIQKEHVQTGHVDLKKFNERLAELKIRNKQKLIDTIKKAA